MMDLQQAFDTGFEAVKRYVDEGFATLEARLAALEARPGMKICDAWRDGQSYEEFSIVMHDGSSWLCRRPTKQKPGTGSDWVLCAKKGRDGRDGKDAR